MKIRLRKLYTEYKALLNSKYILEYVTDYFVTCCIGTTTPKLKNRDVISCDEQNIGVMCSGGQGDKRKPMGYDIVQMYSHKYGITLSQKITDKKNNVSRSIIERLSMINAVHCIFTLRLNQHVT